MKHIDREKNPPTVLTPNTVAWQIDLAQVREHAKYPPGTDAAVAAWVILAPWAHTTWAYYYILAVHLRALPNNGPANIVLEHATHEVLVMALDPERTPNLLAPFSTQLSPILFAGQWVANGSTEAELDADAEAKLHACVSEIIGCELSPDAANNLDDWTDRFGDANLRRDNPAPQL